jgi:DNA-binding NtrC family response regulator
LENRILRFVLLPDLESALADLEVAREPIVQPISEPLNALRDVAAQATDRVERDLVLRTLEKVRWNRKQAARELHIGYKALLKRLRRWQIPGRSPARVVTLAVRAGGTH